MPSKTEASPRPVRRVDPRLSCRRAPDTDLSRLKRLADVPAWLRGIRESHGLTFDPAKARIYWGKKRPAAKLITRWIEGSD